MKTDWERCTRREKCTGAALTPGGSCLAHLNRDRELTAVLRSLGDAGLDARGVEFDELLLTAVVAAAPRTAEERPLLLRCDFTHARFPERARFDEVEFGRETRFDGATFGSRTSFAGASFGERTSFRRATFGGSTRFDRCVFGNRVSFANARFGDGARFEGSRFGDGTTLADTVWGSDTSFAGAAFGARMRADRATFVDRALFRNTLFGSEATGSTHRALTGEGRARLPRIEPSQVRSPPSKPNSRPPGRSRLTGIRWWVCQKRNGILAGSSPVHRAAGH